MTTTTNSPMPFDGRLGASINETCEALSVGRDTVYALINSGELIVSKLGSRTIVHVASIHRLMQKTVITPKPRAHRIQHAAIRATLLAAILAVSTIAAAQAQVPLTIERVRGMAAAGMAPFQSDIQRLSQCPGLRLIPDMAPVEIGELQRDARLARIEPGALWLRRNDPVIARCLGQ